jgi:hypothetical protein
MLPTDQATGSATTPLSLAQGLRDPRAYPHPVSEVRVVETHISWVFLTGTFAYKVKKPVNLGFLDFSTLAQRRDTCADELRLNRRLAAALYLDVVPITGSPESPRIGGSGEAIDYAVRMREFPQSDQLDRLIERDRIGREALERFACHLADFHRAAPRAGKRDRYGQLPEIQNPLSDSLAELITGTDTTADHAVLAALQRWCSDQAAGLEETFRARKSAGMIRECHGDLHLANMVRWQGEILAFDCLEFSAALRWIDVINDVAFLVMDLIYRGHGDLAYRFFNAYLEATGDYDGVNVLRYYFVYRALVRARVAMIRCRSGNSHSRDNDLRSVRAHIALASRWTQPPPPMLILMHGLSGSGKTRLSDALLPQLPAIRVRSDLERKRLHGLPALASTESAIDAGLYTSGSSVETYFRLEQAARTILAAGENVIVDAAFLQRAQRDQFARLAQALGVAFVIVECCAPAAELDRRVAARKARGDDASEAGAAVLEHQRKHLEPLDPSERAYTLSVDTVAEFDPASIICDLRQRARLAAN